ncbi:MAG: winged helix-turn-helix transcriptional regulator [Candidatus Hodarchaeota archaeon]
MVKIDLKDRKILYQLDIDSRKSSSQIGKEVGLPKHVVNYHINNLIKNGVIENFYTLINAYKLGYIGFRLYIIFQYLQPNKKREIIDYFVKEKKIWVVDSVIGRFHLTLSVWVDNIEDFYRFWNKTLDKYGDYFADYICSTYIYDFTYRYSYLLLDKYDKSDRMSYEITGGGKKVDIEKFDIEILNNIALNARIPLNTLSEILNCSPKTIRKRINNLIKLGIIQGFRTNIDISKLGLKYFKVDIFFKEYNQRKKIINYIKYNPNLINIGTTIGFSGLDLSFHLEHLNNLHQIMDDLKRKFPTAIKNYQYFIVSKIYKMRYMPEL